MFIISLTYKKPIADVEQCIEEHNALLEKLTTQNKLIFSGRKNPRTGGVIVVYNLTRKQVDEIIEQDPFYRNEIASYEVVEVIARKYAEQFAFFVEK